MTSAGFGSAVITPPLPVVLAGFGARKEPAREVHDDLEVHAFVVTDGPTTLCLLVLDLLMLGPDVAGPIRAAVGVALGITPAQVLTSCTHTHSGPAATKSVRRIGWPMPEGYGQTLVDGCVAAATRARASREPAQLAYARASLPSDLSLNRRGLPYDPTYAIMDVQRPDGTRIGTVANVGIHPVALGISCLAVSGDWVTTFREQARAALGAPVMLLPGALGDVNPTRDPHTEPDPGGNWETARVLGEEVADCVTGLLPHATAVGGAIEVVARRLVRVRAGLTIPAVLAGVAGRAVEVELLEWSLGGIRLVSLPGEAFHALGRAVEQARDDRTLLAGLAPTWHGYLPAPFGKGYEEKMSYGRGFVRRVGELLTMVP